MHLVHKLALPVMVVALLTTAACAASESDPVTADGEPTRTPVVTSPTALPTTQSLSPVPTETAAIEAVPTETTALAVPTEPASVQPTTVTVSPTAVGSAETEPPGTQVNTGLLQDQFCVVDIVAPDTLNVRLGPSTNDEIVAMLDEGECRIYLAGGEAGSWREVIVDRDTAVRGWVSANFIRAVRAPVDPDAPTTVITVTTLEFGIDRPETQPTIDAFRLVNGDGLVVGFLDTAGQITVPADLDVGRARIEAEFVGDPFCAWTGQLRFEGSGNQYSAELLALCA